MIKLSIALLLLILAVIGVLNGMLIHQCTSTQTWESCIERASLLRSIFWDGENGGLPARYGDAEYEEYLASLHLD